MRSIRLLLLLAVIGGFAASAKAYTIEGQVTGGQGGLTLKIVLCVPVTVDTFFTTIVIPIINSYSLSNLDSNGYVLFAYQDLNTNLTPDLDEPRGFYGGEIPEVLTVESDLENIDIELTSPNDGGFTGTVTYAGTSTGATMIFGYRDSISVNVPTGAGFLLVNTGNGDYTAFVDSFGTFYAFAFMDLNTNLTPDEDEPFGFYGGETAEPFEIEPTNFPDEIDITMLDPVIDAAEPTATLPEQFSLGEPYPNPFNGQTTIPFELTNTSEIQLSVFDLMGRTSMELIRGTYPAGEHSVAFNGEGRASGIYIVSLIADGRAQVRRLVYLK
jgi:hypothetical protein